MNACADAAPGHPVSPLAAPQHETSEPGTGRVRTEGGNGVAAGSSDVVLYTPAQAARLLAVPESWLRRQAGQRRIPATRLGKHLRFSHADLARIAADSAQPVRQTRSLLRPR